jgi:hypothetical protein
MITVNSLSDISIGGIIQHGDVVTVANQAFAHGKAAELLAALDQWAQTKLVPVMPAINQIDEQHQQEIAVLQAEIAQLKLETAPGIASIAPALQTAGLTAWADRAITAADPDHGVLNLVLALYAVAQEPRSLTQCDRVRELFMQIGDLSGVWPAPEEAMAMQTILDANNVGNKWLKFV